MNADIKVLVLSSNGRYQESKAQKCLTYDLD
jgi:hypothetical protein